jgi:hypothetical protein
MTDAPTKPMQPSRGDVFADVRQHSRFMIRIVKCAAKGVIVMFVMTIVCTFVWQEFVTDNLYKCTDPGWLDFLSPGNWVHGQFAIVPIVKARAMSDPDTIKAGWSISRLWYLWYSFVAVSLVISILLARLRWIPKRSAKEIFEVTHAG